jgi:hypothetical protein
VLSALVLAVAWGLRVALRLAPGKLLDGRLGHDVQLDPRRVGAMLTEGAWVLLCSGSYVLFDVEVPEERLRFSVRLI